MKYAICGVFELALWRNVHAFHLSLFQTGVESFILPVFLKWKRIPVEFSVNSLSHAGVVRAAIKQRRRKYNKTRNKYSTKSALCCCSVIRRNVYACQSLTRYEACLYSKRASYKHARATRSRFFRFSRFFFFFFKCHLSASCEVSIF